MNTQDLCQRYGLNKAQADALLLDMRKRVLAEIKENDWLVVPRYAPKSAMRAAYKHFADYTYYYAKVWAVMTEMMPEYQGKPLPQTDDLLGDAQRVIQLDADYRESARQYQNG